MNSRRLITGLLTAQAVATVHVRLSNTALLQKTRSLLQAGHIAVPGGPAAETLLRWDAAFFGGMFYTATIGLGITLLSLAVFSMWGEARGRVPWRRVGIGVMWAGLIAALNANGFSAAGTAYATLIPAAVLGAGLRWKAPHSDRRRTAVIHLAALVFLALFSARHLDGAFFSGVRDRLLFSGAVGISINHFYYRYTLYAAQAFKSLDQELIRTCRITGPENPAAEQRLRRLLARLDWVDVGGSGPVDMEVSFAGARLALSHDGAVVLTAPEGDFFARPKALLSEFSRKTDRSAGIRGAAFLSLAALLLLGAYGALYLPARWAAARCFGPARAALPAAAAAAAGGAALLFLAPWGQLSPGAATGCSPGPGPLIQADDVELRIAGLACLYHQGLDVADVADVGKLARSPDLRERYWLAKALAVSRDPSTLPALAALVSDSRINVAYQACQAMGRRGDRRGIPALLLVIGRSPYWYVQMYAYRALKRLGWHQSASG